MGLRAELQKKRDEANRHPPGQRGREKLAVKPKSYSSSNAGVSDRASKDVEQRQAEERTEETARQVLERKAAMYDKLHQGTEVLEDDHLNQRFLVNFQKKIVNDVMDRKKTREEKEKARKNLQKNTEEANPDEYKAEDEDQEWVEYTDAFGRTRECLRSELPEKLEQDKQLSRDINPQEKEAEEEAPLDPHSVEDLYREARRKKWEAEEELNASKKDLHYQDVLYDEARTHGAGFLKFSKDEKERKAQMEQLRDLRVETKQAEAVTSAKAARKRKAMMARLEKVRQRKRLKIGLPIKDDDRLKTPPGSEDEEEEEDKVVDPTPTPPSPPPRKKVGGVREWDLGKEGVTSTLTQEEWVLRQRSQRSQEFAPPSSYQPRAGKSHGHAGPSQSQSYEDTMRESPPPDPKEPLRDKRVPEFAPPATHDYYGPSTTKGRRPQKSTSDVEAAISKGLAHLRKLSDQ